MTQAEIRFALNDIKATLAIYADQPQTNYTRKLWAEWDALIVQAKGWTVRIGDVVEHPEHKNPVKITEIDGDMIAFTVYPPSGGAFRMWNHRARFVGRLW